MENSVKALLIAAGVLIGMMILSLGVSLFASLNSYVESVQENIASIEIQKFNGQFTKYINYNDDTDEKDFTLTIQDIVTAANIARENNLSYNLTGQTGSNYYVTINMPGHSNLEQIINLQSADILANGLGKEYICSYGDVEINTVTGRVFEVNFQEYTVP